MTTDSKPTYKELEERVRELEAGKTLREQSDFDGLIENLQVGVLVYGPDGAVIKSNATARMILGLTHDQLVGKDPIDPAWTLLREDGSPLPVEEYPISRVMATKESACDMVAGIRHSYEVDPIWVLDTAIPEKDKNGQIVRVITTFTDISARKNSEEKYRNLFEHTMQEVHLWKLVRDKYGSIATWRLVDANPTALKAWRKSHSETIGKTPNEIFSYDAVEQFMPIVEKIFSEDKPYTWEEYFPPTGQYVYMTSVPFGEYFMSTGTDISDRKQAEDALRVSEERHRLFNNPLFGGSVIHDKGRILDCSGGLSYITGYSHDELIGMDGLLLIAPEWRDFVKDKIASCSDEPYEAEGIRKDGTIYPVRIHAKSIQYHGKSVRVGEFRDISDIKKTEQALEESERLLRNIIDSSTDYIFVKDQDFRTVLCNKTFAQAVNKKPGDLIGKTDIENGWDAELVKGYEKDDLEALSGKIIRNTDTATISGKTFYFDSVKIPLIDENETIFGVLGISRDITERKNAQEEIRRQLAEKQKLLKEVHHRIKNNLAQVEGLLSLQAGLADSADVEAALHGAMSRVGSIRALYDQLLVRDDSEEVSVKDYLEGVIHALGQVWGIHQGITIEKQIEDFALSSKNVVPLGIILNELLTNVSKYAFVGKDEGRVLIKLEKVDSRVTLTVEDNGVGFDELTMTSGTSGFGTAIVKGLAEQFDGTFTMDGENGTTSTVTLYI